MKQKIFSAVLSAAMLLSLLSGCAGGLEVPTSLDELHDALKAFKDNDMSARYYGNAPGSTLPMTTGFDEWYWGQNIFYSGFGFTNWPNDVINDIHLGSAGKAEFVCVSDAYRTASSLPSVSRAMWGVLPGGTSRS